MVDFLNVIIAYLIFDSYELVQLSCAISLLKGGTLKKHFNVFHIPCINQIKNI